MNSGKSLSDPRLLQLAVQHHQAGRLSDAESIYRQILAQDPNHPDALHLLGVLSHQTGNVDTAVQLIGRSVVLKPDFADSHNNLGNALLDKGRVDEAIASYRRATMLRGNFPEAYNNLGKALKLRNQADEAIEACQRAIQLKPDYPEPYINLGNALVDKANYPEAVAAYRRAIQLKPDFPMAHYNLGNALFLMRDLDAAIAEFRMAIQIQPDCAEAYNNLGGVFSDREQFDKAIAVFQTAIRLRPNDPHGRINLGNALAAMRKYDQAISVYSDVARLHPNMADAHNGLGNVLKELGRLEESISAYRRATELQPDQPIFHSNLIFAINFHPSFDAPAILREARQWDHRHGQAVRHLIQPHRNTPDPARRVKIGYVSADFRDHVVAWNLLPLLRNHDHGQFEIFCYSSVIHTADKTTERLRSFSDHWREITSLSHQQLAGQIRSDAIDLLIDLSLHTSYNRLVTFAMEPAPVQITYLGYAGTSGLQSMHYRLSDPYLDPSGQNLADYSEQSVRLPKTYWCYEPGGPTPDPSAPPVEQNGFVTFGCLNQFCKVSAVALELWHQVLAAVPNSRLIIHAPPGNHLQSAIQQLCHDGVNPDRVEFVGRQSWDDYIRTFHRIDIALDPLPYSGGITTCDTLWMGVPVVTLSGRTSVGRAGRSILSNIGLPELIAYDPDQYIRLAAELASDPNRMADIRRSLRDRMKASPLMDARQFSTDVEAAYRMTWRNWCSKKGFPLTPFAAR